MAVFGGPFGPEGECWVVVATFNTASCRRQLGDWLGDIDHAFDVAAN